MNSLRLAKTTSEVHEFTPLTLDGFVGPDRADQGFRCSDAAQERRFAW